MLWTMGLLEPADWHARWITAEPTSKSTKGKLTILQASYEAVDRQGAKDVTALLAKKAKSGTLVIVVGNQQLGGDPALNHVKQLRLKYELNGKMVEKTVPEAGTLVLPEGLRGDSVPAQSVLNRQADPPRDRLRDRSGLV